VAKGQSCTTHCHWVLVCLFILFSIVPSTASAHPSLSAFVQHRIAVTVDAQNIDVSIEVNFRNRHARLERNRMDTDRNGTISDAESRVYLQQLIEDYVQAVSLQVAGEALDLIPLYSPRLELGADRTTRGAEHTLRLSLFARTPKDLPAPCELEVHETFFPEAPAFYHTSVTGRAGLEAKLKSDRTTIRPAASESTPTLIRAEIFTSQAGNPARAEGTSEGMETISKERENDAD